MQIKIFLPLLISTSSFLIPFVDIKSSKAGDLIEQFRSQEKATYQKAQYHRDQGSTNYKYFIDASSNIYEFVNNDDGFLIGNLKEKNYVTREDCLHVLSCEPKEITYQYLVENDNLYAFQQIRYLRSNTKSNIEKIFLGAKKRYIGDYLNGYRHGQGTFTYKDGAKYVGEWKDGKRHGLGTMTYKDGSEYVGDYRNGLPNGQGTLMYKNDSKYVGKYVGEFKDGSRHGQGTYTSAEGITYQGEWKDGEFVEENGYIY